MLLCHRASVTVEVSLDRVSAMTAEALAALLGMPTSSVGIVALGSPSPSPVSSPGARLLTDSLLNLTALTLSVAPVEGQPGLSTQSLLTALLGWGAQPGIVTRSPGGKLGFCASSLPPFLCTMESGAAQRPPRSGICSHTQCLAHLCVVGDFPSVCCAGCGNQRCELGEACTTANCTGGAQCIVDCPINQATARCPRQGTMVGHRMGPASGWWAAVGPSSPLPAYALTIPVCVSMGTLDIHVCIFIGKSSTAYKLEGVCMCAWAGGGGLAVCTWQVCSGHGDCLGQSGYCGCYSGYTGASCSECAPGYLPLRSYCVFLPGALATCSDGVRNGEEEGVDCGGPTCGQRCSAAAGSGLQSSDSRKVSVPTMSLHCRCCWWVSLEARLDGCWASLLALAFGATFPHVSLPPWDSRWCSLALLGVLVDWPSWSAPSCGSLPLPLAGWDCGRNQVGETRGPPGGRLGGVWVCGCGG
jgi:hypothetical protein